MTSGEQVGVVVTLQMIYETVRGVEQTVQRIDTTLSEVVKDQADHEQRIRTLEAGQGRLTGKLAGVGVSVGLFVSAAGTFIFNKLFGG